MSLDKAIETIESMCLWAMIGMPRAFMEIAFHRMWPEHPDRTEVEIARLVYRTYAVEGDTEELALNYLVEKVTEAMLKDNLKYSESVGDQCLLFWRLPEKISVEKLDTGIYLARTRIDWTPRTPE